MGAELQYSVELNEISFISFDEYSIKNNTIYLIRNRRNENSRYTATIEYVSDLGYLDEIDFEDRGLDKEFVSYKYYLEEIAKDILDGSVLLPEDTEVFIETWL